MLNRVFSCKTVFALPLLCALSACESNQPSQIFPTTPFAKIELTSSIESDAQLINATHTYIYNRKGRVSNYTSLQRFTAIEPVEIKQEATVTYTPQQAIITDAFGNVSTYMLNENGYAISCTQQEGLLVRTYTFAYLINTEGKHYLTNITERLNDGNIFSSIDIGYSHTDLSIKYKINTFEQIYTAKTLINQKSTHTPCLFLAELHPLSLHNTALYGKLLGEPFEAPIAQIIPSGNNANNETITYTYSTNSQGIITSCKAVTNSYGTNYIRTVNYVIE